MELHKVTSRLRGTYRGDLAIPLILCGRGVMAATRRLERRAEMRAGSSPVVRTKYARMMEW